MDGNKEDQPLLEGGAPGNGKPCGGGGGNGNLWNVFRASLKDAIKGLSQASGVKTGTQRHHMLSNKNSTYTPQYEKITNEYELKLNDGWNIYEMENHSGRHTNEYHEFMLSSVKSIHAIAKGNQSEFLYGFSILVDIVTENTWVFYAK